MGHPLAVKDAVVYYIHQEVTLDATQLQCDCDTTRIVDGTQSSGQNHCVDIQ